MDQAPRFTTIAEDGWTLLSAEDRANQHPKTFAIPPRSVREALTRGDAAKLLFDIEVRESGHVVDRGTERMWVVVSERGPYHFVGLLANTPAADHPTLKEGSPIIFGPEHVCDCDRPPQEFITKMLGL